MSDIMTSALETLQSKIGDGGINGSLKLEIEGEGAIRIDENGASADDGSDADCTVSAAADTFEGLFSGDVDPTSAFMMGKIKVDGDMGVAMQLSSLLS